MNLFKESLLRQAEALEALPTPELIALIVDDEVGYLRVLRSMLSDRFVILEAGDGPEALVLISRLPPERLPAVILSDQRMPKMTGVDLFERLRESVPDAIRIIVTGFVDVGAIVDAINRAGIYRFLVKPYNQSELNVTVDLAIEAHRSRGRETARRSELENELLTCRARLQSSESELARLHGELAKFNVTTAG